MPKTTNRSLCLQQARAYCIIKNKTTKHYGTSRDGQRNVQQQKTKKLPKSKAQKLHVQATSTRRLRMRVLCVMQAREQPVIKNAIERDVYVCCREVLTPDVSITDEDGRFYGGLSYRYATIFFYDRA